MPVRLRRFFSLSRTVAHIVYLHNVNIRRALARGAPSSRTRQRRNEAILLFNSSAGTDDHPDLPSSPKRSLVSCKPLFLLWIADYQGTAKNKLKKRLDTCLSVIVNYNSD
jgi:hypothetical protein